MITLFNPDEWQTVLPRQRHGMFAAPHLEPAAIVSQETGSELEECLGCGQFRENVAAVAVEHGLIDVCRDCRQEYGI